MYKRYCDKCGCEIKDNGDGVKVTVFKYGPDDGKKGYLREGDSCDSCAKPAKDLVL